MKGNGPDTGGNIIFTQDEIADLMKKNTNLENTLRDLAADLESAKKQSIQSEERNASLERQIEMLQAQSVIDSNKKAELNSLLGEYSQKEYENQGSVTGEEIDRMRSEIMGLNKELKDGDVKIKELLGLNDEFEKIIDQLKSDKLLLSEENGKISDKLRQFKEEAERFRDLEERNDDITAKNDKLNLAKQKLELQNNELKDVIKKQNSEIDAAQLDKEKIFNAMRLLNEENQSLTYEVLRLKDSVARYEEEKAENVNSESNNGQNLEGLLDFDELNKEIEQLKEELLLQANSNAILQQQIKQLQEQLKIEKRNQALFVTPQEKNVIDEITQMLDEGQPENAMKLFQSANKGEKNDILKHLERKLLNQKTDVKILNNTGRGGASYWQLLVNYLKSLIGYDAHGYLVDNIKKDNIGELKKNFQYYEINNPADLCNALMHKSSAGTSYPLLEAALKKGDHDMVLEVLKENQKFGIHINSLESPSIKQDLLLHFEKNKFKDINVSYLPMFFDAKDLQELSSLKNSTDKNDRKIAETISKVGNELNNDVSNNTANHTVRLQDSRNHFPINDKSR